jgi:hypothetical protein
LDEDKEEDTVDDEEGEAGPGEGILNERVAVVAVDELWVGTEKAEWRDCVNPRLLKAEGVELEGGMSLRGEMMSSKLINGGEADELVWELSRSDWLSVRERVAYWLIKAFWYWDMVKLRVFKEDDGVGLKSRELAWTPPPVSLRKSEALVKIPLREPRVVLLPSIS